MAEKMKKQLNADSMKNVSGGYIVDGGGSFGGYDNYESHNEYFKSKEEAEFHAKGVGVCPYCGKKLS